MLGCERHLPRLIREFPLGSFHSGVETSSSGEMEYLVSKHTFHIYKYTHTHIYTHIYIYIHRERETVKTDLTV